MDDMRLLIKYLESADYNMKEERIIIMVGLGRQSGK